MKIFISKIHNLDILLIGIFLFEVGSILRVQFDQQLIGNFIRIVGVFATLYSLFIQIHRNHHFHFTSSMRFLFAWNLINIIGSIVLTGLDLTRTFGEDTYILNMLLPFILLYDIESLNFNRFFKFITLYAIITLVIIVFNFDYILHANSVDFIQSVKNDVGTLAQLPIMISIPASLVLMNINTFRKKTIILACLAYIFAIAFSMSFGRRSTSLYGTVFLVFALYMYYKNPHVKKVNKYVLSLMIIILVPISIYLTVSHFSFLMERGLVDSRSGVNDSFIADMSFYDFIFGRGVNGEYYDPLPTFDKIGNLRTANETGFLNVILHSGLLFLIPYVCIIIATFFKGFFTSKSIFVKSFALYVLINTLMLIIGSYPSFTLRFFALWIGILICNNRKLLMMRDQEIYDYLKIEKI